MATCSVINAEIPEKESGTKSQNNDITVIIGIFFDGTNNQRLQVLIGKMYREKKKRGNTLTADEKELVRKFATDGLSKGLNKDTRSDKGDVLTDDDIKSIYEKHHFRLMGFSRADMRADNFTNIAIMEPFYNPVKGGSSSENTYDYKIYVTGSGTYADIEKSTSGNGLGMGKGDSGVVQKVKDALDAIGKRIIERINTNGDIVNVDYSFHLFGFSRGSTEARLFVDLCSDNRQSKLIKVIKKYNKEFNADKNSKYTKAEDRIHFSREGKLQFPFVGIFDTVSSVGVIRKSIWNPIVTKASSLIYGYHDENVEYLGLNTLAHDEVVEKVVHICAMDEYRENFALVTVPNVVNRVEQFFLPGAHADIGGGYLPGYSPEIVIPKNLFIPDVPMVSSPSYKKIEKNELIKQGWIENGSTEILSDDKDSTINIRRKSLDGYSYLPLHLMVEKSGGLFDDSIEEKFKIPAGLPSNFDKLKNESTDTTYGKCYYPDAKSNVWGVDYPTLRKLYLHFSSNIDSTITQAKMIVNGPYYDAKNHLQRIIYDGNDPQRWFMSSEKPKVTEATPEECNNLMNNLYSHSF